MPMRKETWPIEALPNEAALAPVVESFLAEGFEFDFSQSGIRQLYDRIDELDGNQGKHLPIYSVNMTVWRFALQVSSKPVQRNRIGQLPHNHHPYP